MGVKVLTDICLKILEVLFLESFCEMSRYVDPKPLTKAKWYFLRSFGLKDNFRQGKKKVGSPDVVFFFKLYSKTSSKSRFRANGISVALETNSL